MNPFVFLNSDFVPEEDAFLHFRDLSVQRGYGVFDFFKVSNGFPVFLEEHLTRFYFSAEQMRLNIGYRKAELRKIVTQLLHKNNAVDTGVRITLTGGYSADGYQLAKPNLIISLHSFAPPTPEQREKGVKLIMYEYQRQLPHVKTIDYLMAIWLQTYIKEHQGDDVLYHQNGIVTECPRSNFFIVNKDDIVVTPVSNILKGVVRTKLIEAAKKSFHVEERNVSIDEIKTAKEAFITSTTKTTLPVHQVNDYVFPSRNRVATQLYHSILELQSKLTETA